MTERTVFFKGVNSYLDMKGREKGKKQGFEGRKTLNFFIIAFSIFKISSKFSGFCVFAHTITLTWTINQ